MIKYINNESEWDRHNESEREGERKTKMGKLKFFLTCLSKIQNGARQPKII